MSGITVSLRRQIWREQQGRCWYCDIPLEPPKSLKEEALVACICRNCQQSRITGPTNGMGINVICIRGQLDPVVPLCFGGSDQRDNLVYACTVCNQAKTLQDPFLKACRNKHRTGGHPGYERYNCPLCAQEYVEMQGFASEREQKERTRGVLPHEVAAYRGRWVAAYLGMLGEEVAATDPTLYEAWLQMRKDAQECARGWSVIRHYRDAMDELWHVEWDSLLNDLFAAGFTAMQINSEIDRLHTSKRARAKGPLQ